jgi:anaerobic magnesium-protoporphyrin IX monomethyl ester cyclase
MKKVLLITPYGFQNVGVRMLSAVLRRDGFAAPILFLKAWRNNDVVLPSTRELRLLEEYVEREQPDVIGIGFGTPYLALVTDLTRRIRRVSDAHVIWGGVHPTICPEDCIDHADSVCVGEGELPLLDLARAIRDGRPATGIANLWVRTADGVERNPPRPLIADLDTLPFATMAEAEMVVIEGGELAHGNPSEDNALYRVMASRGCPFHCAFCYNSQFRQIYDGLGRYHRVRTVERVMQELEQAVAALPRLRRIRFDDDTFVFPRSWIEEFVREYPRRIGLPFDVLLNAEATTHDTLRMLAGAGLVHVQVGVQSGSESELEEHYARKGSNERILDLAQQLHDLGVEVTYDVILDNPLASRPDKQAMLDLLLRLPRPFNIFLYSLTLFPKSEITLSLLAEGRITEDDVEGRATKSFSQFRLSLSYPRPAEDTFYASLISLTSKGFLPRRAIQAMSHSPWLHDHPTPLRYGAEVANAVKLGGTAWRMLRRGELSAFKLTEYASFRRRLIQ